MQRSHAETPDAPHPRTEELLAGVPLFASMPEHGHKLLAEAVTAVPFHRGAVICREGDPGGSMFIVASGRVEILLEEPDGETVLAQLLPGEFFGELAVLDGEPRSATARAANDCLCLVLRREQLFGVLHEPHVLENLLAVLAGRVRAADQLLSARSIDNRELQRETLTDPLCRVGNRRKLDRDLQTLEARMRRYGHSFGLAMCDIDNFKKFNDTYGHAKGDEALRAVAQAMSRQSRGGDEVYRYGGEEFVIVMPAASADAAASGLNRIRESIQQLGIPHAGNPPAQVLTISAGVAMMAPGNPGAATDVLLQADAALYAAKQGGRNQVALG